MAPTPAAISFATCPKADDPIPAMIVSCEIMAFGLQQSTLWSKHVPSRANGVAIKIRGRAFFAGLGSLHADAVLQEPGAHRIQRIGMGTPAFHRVREHRPAHLRGAWRRDRGAILVKAQTGVVPIQPAMGQ
jgi:hypothetical protein